MDQSGSASKRQFVAIDVETTGLSPARGDRVIEIGAIAIKGGRVVDEYSTLVRVNRPISWAAQKVHGIDSNMLMDSPVPHDVWPQFALFIKDATLLAHNASFDVSFLRHEFSRIGLALPNPHHCTLALSRRLLPHLPNHRLETVAGHLLGEIPKNYRLHRALDDAQLVARVWLEMKRREG